MKTKTWIIVPMLLLTVCSCNNASLFSGRLYDYTGWSSYAGSKDGNRYSSNEQLNLSNVKQLQEVWRYTTKDKDSTNKSQIQCNPIIVDGILYGTSPRLKLFAIDAATGEQKWLFDPFNKGDQKKDKFSAFNVNRGVSYWQSEDGDDKRILYSVGSRLYAINAQDGSPVSSFGMNGFIDLKNNLDHDNTENAYVAGTSPGVVYKDLIIMGMRLSEGPDALPGHIRAFDVRTGERKWIFHTIPHPGEFGYETWEDPTAYKRIGGANNWGGMSLDEKKGIVYISTGSATPDFYGGVRKGANLFANSIIALEAATGKYCWHYQVVHHDLWDRDLPANPNLITVKHNGKTIEAIGQVTKHGYVFVLDRATGKPLFPVEEIPMPPSDLPGEEQWPTQPIPTLPERFSRSKFDREDIFALTPESRKYLEDKFDQINYHAEFTPPSKEGIWIYPGTDGGAEWGGAAVDVESGILYINSNEVPYSITMIDVPKKDPVDRSFKGAGKVVYNRYCITCHGADLKGNGSSIPSLANIDKRLKQEQVVKIVENGRNMMPSFKQITTDEKQRLLTFLFNLEVKGQRKDLSSRPGGSEASNAKEPSASTNTLQAKSLLDEVPFTITGYNKFLDKDGFPGIKPPWGTLNAIDLNSGKIVWKVPLGEYDELTKNGMPVTGTENYGGPLVTKGGLVIIAATRDEKIRAFDKKTGKVLWEAKLPAAGYATPATYMVHGRQYIVIACGGGKLGTKSGDEYVAFALPR